MVRNVAGAIGSVVRRSNGDGGAPERESCLVCSTNLLESDLYARNRICPVCNFHYSMTARERIDSLADPGTFRERNRRVSSLDPLSFSAKVSYKQRLFLDQRRTGLSEAVVTGTCSIGGSPAVLAVLDFGFMGGSMGCVVGEKVALAMERAAKRRLPFVTVVTSGGARVQEGVLSLMQMAKTVIAASQLHEKGLPLITVLANPATGHAYASFANLADIILAEPGAIVGLAPMRAIRESSSQPIPGGSHTSDSHLAHGIVDDVVHRSDLRDKIAVLLELLGPRYRLEAQRKAEPRQPSEHRPPAWDSVQLARHSDRPTAMDYLSRIMSSFVEIHGDRVHGDDGAVVCGIGYLGSQTVVVIGQERGRQGDPVERNGGRTSPEGFRKALRAADLAEKFDLPIITLIDTPGPLLSLEAEERGLGHTIAAMMARMAGLSAPVVAVITGEGGSEGALALGLANRVLMLENAIYTVISPEEAAGLFYQDQTRADEAAESLRLTARGCEELGIIDQIVQEPPGGAHVNPDEAARHLRRALLKELSELQPRRRSGHAAERRKKFRNMGEYSSSFRSTISRDVHRLQGLAASGVRKVTRRSAPEPENHEGIPAGEERT